MQVQLRQHRADFLSPPLEEREDLAFKPFRQIADPWTLHQHRPIQHRKGARFPVAVSAPGRRIDRRDLAPALMPGSTEERGHFLFQELLQLGLNPSSRPLLQAYPFPSAVTEALVDSSTERLRRLYLISTPKDGTSNMR
jgi:hypothetical protein